MIFKRHIWSTNRVNIAPIALSLWMLQGITIHLTGTGYKEPGVNPLCQTKHVQCPHHICLVKQDKPNDKFDQLQARLARPHRVG
ncbi:hypothetical protein Leryth_020429 [Lithospermum erythrorhizon]|nr:hypothetical protein Leryth_020429 [Lithospermum erythrorhizon]